MRIGLAFAASQSLQRLRGAVWVRGRLDIVDAHETSRLNNLASADEVIPGIARDRHQARDGTAAVRDFDRLPRRHFLQIPTRVLAQLADPYRPHVLHSGT